jgi:phenylpropionate dioxygenase-like ring-hydroxylating dioxygenase large terminal subunit
MTAFPALRRHWFIACRSRSLGRRPLARTVLGNHLVLFRGAGGAAQALTDSCPHRHAPLSAGWVSGDRIICPYHGWQFDGEGVCRLVAGWEGEQPHRVRNVASYPVREQDGFVWVHPDMTSPPSAEPYRFPLLDDRRYRTRMAEFRVAAELPDALENFLDATHTHFVHRGLIRREGSRRRVRVLVRRQNGRVDAEYVDDGQDSGWVARIFGGGIDTSIDRFLLPSVVQLEHRRRDEVRLLITLFFSPETETSSRVYAVATGRGDPVRSALAMTLGRWLLLSVVRQDRRILELQLRNRQRFGTRPYTSTPIDIFRPHVLRLLGGDQGSSGPADDPSERIVDMLI